MRTMYLRGDTEHVGPRPSAGRQRPEGGVPPGAVVAGGRAGGSHSSTPFEPDDPPRLCPSAGQARDSRRGRPARPLGAKPYLSALAVIPGAQTDRWRLAPRGGYIGLLALRRDPHKVEPLRVFRYGPDRAEPSSFPTYRSMTRPSLFSGQLATRPQFVTHGCGCGSTTPAEWSSSNGAGHGSSSSTGIGRRG
jgi:hypothetical protein